MKLKRKMEWTIGKEINSYLMNGNKIENIEEDTGYTIKEAKFYIFAFNTVNRLREFEMYGMIPSKHSYLSPEDFNLTNQDIIDYMKRTNQYIEEEKIIESDYQKIGYSFGNWFDDEDDE